MFSVIEALAVNAAAAILHRVIKSPASADKEKQIIAHLAQVATDADAAVNGAVWTRQ